MDEKDRLMRRLAVERLDLTWWHATPARRVLDDSPEAVARRRATLDRIAADEAEGDET